MTQRENFDLEALFDGARAQPPQMPDWLSDRIVADAMRHLPSVPLWRRVIAAVGGPAGLGGLVTATVAGFWFGVAPPADTVDPLVLFGAVEVSADYDYTDLTGFGWDIEEG
ncbi:hypothetical protein [Sulfitobacter sp.]|uniref:hypothetical protein n=1 Tax=Sulfitobacter sp. TaxID=1903071 RepID=UPI003EF22C96